MTTPPVLFHHLQKLAVRDGSSNPAVRAVAADGEYHRLLAELVEGAPGLPATDAELETARRAVADAMVALAKLDQALGLGVEGELAARFFGAPASSSRAA